MAIATVTMKNFLADEYGARALYAALFSSDPGSSGTVVGELIGGTPAYARQPIAWGTSVNGVRVATVVFNVPAGLIAYFGVCSGASGSNLLDKCAIGPATPVAQDVATINITFTEV